MFNSWGIVVSFGIYQTYYTTGGIQDETSPSSIAWIGSMQAFLLTAGGALGGKYFDNGYFRQMLWAGTFFVVFGMMMTSISTKYYQIMLSQGICVGIGSGLFLVPSVGLPGTWFERKRGLAIGIVTMGSSIGGIVYPIMLFKLIPQVGFPWATRIQGFVALGMLVIPLSISKLRIIPRKRGSFIEYTALKEPVFAIFVLGVFLTLLGFFTFYNFIGVWALKTHVNTHGLANAYLLAIVNASSAFGRIIPGYLSDLIGPLTVQAPCIAIAGTLVLAWLGVHNFGSVITLCILYGFFSGAFLGLQPSSVAALCPDMSKFGGRIGVVFMAMGFAALIGSPVTGAIVQMQSGSYDGARVWAGVTMLVGSGLLVVARCMKTGWVVGAKA